MNNNNEKDNDILSNQLNQVLVLLQTVQCQVKRISNFQDQTYTWNTKHHQHLQNVLRSFNKISSIFNNSGNGSGCNNKKEISKEDTQNSVEPNQTFHHKILSAYDPLNPFSGELQNLIMQIDRNLFDQLEEESIMIIYPFLLKWLKEETQDLLVVALVLIWEISLKFNHFGKKFKVMNKKLKVCLLVLESKGIINSLHVQGVFPFSEDEYNNLKLFLE